MPCKGICQRYVAIKPPIPHTRYGSGQKRCSICDVFMNLDGERCPCCNHVLRTRPKGTKSREQFSVIRQVERI